MRTCRLKRAMPMKRAIQLLPVTLVAASVAAGWALAQTPSPGSAAGPKLKAPVAQPGPTPTQYREGARAAAAAPLVSQSTDPTYDEGTAQRISAAMLSYSAIEVRGGWPTIPQNAKVAPGARGPDVA